MANQFIIILKNYLLDLNEYLWVSAFEEPWMSGSQFLQVLTKFTRTRISEAVRSVI